MDGRAGAVGAGLLRDEPRVRAAQRCPAAFILDRGSSGRTANHSADRRVASRPAGCALRESHAAGRLRREALRQRLDRQGHREPDHDRPDGRASTATCGRQDSDHLLPHGGDDRARAACAGSAELAQPLERAALLQVATGMLHVLSRG